MALAKNLINLFHEEGYFALERIITDQDLAELCLECQRNLDLQVTSMERVGAETLGLTQKEERYFRQNRYEESPFLERFLFSDQMLEIISSVVGR